MAVPDRRTMIVLAVLVAAMTLVSGVLLGLEPGPRHVAVPPSLSAVNVPVPGPLSHLFDTRTPMTPHRWADIAIHFSGTAGGSAKTLDTLQRRIGLSGLAYHMVIGNGSGANDGQLQFGNRWNQQQAGISGLDLHQNPAGRRTVDICLIGDGNRQPPTEAQMRTLVSVVQKLQRKFTIGPDHVLLYTDSQTGRGRLFPVALFRQQLLTWATPGS